MASTETPVFGSQENARQWGHDLKTALDVSMYGTIFLRPETGPMNRLKTFGVDFAATAFARNSARPFKGWTERTRPDESDDLSFPSGHSTAASAYAAIGSRNIDASHLGPRWKTGMKIGLRSMAAATAWARVEGGKHYPTDVLAGAALGNFLALLVNDTLLPPDSNMELSLNLNDEGGQVMFHWRF